METKVIMGKKINLYLPLRTGGPTVWGSQLASHLRYQKIDVTVLNTLSGYLSHPFRTGINHSTLPFFTPAPLSSKSILTIHGDYPNEQTPWSRFYPRAIKLADEITVPSQFLKKKLGLKDCHVIYNGINPSLTHKLNYKVNERQITVGILTNFNFPEKARGVIELAKVIKKTNLPIKLIVGGDGKDIDRYKELVGKILPSNEFLGFCKKEDLFSKIDIFTYYSFQDTFSISLLEAMEYGLPVITNNVGAVDEILTENLSTYIANNPTEYLNNLLGLVTNEYNRVKNSQLSKNRSKYFLWQEIIPEWIKLYGIK